MAVPAPARRLARRESVGVLSAFAVATMTTGALAMTPQPESAEAAEAAQAAGGVDRGSPAERAAAPSATGPMSASTTTSARVVTAAASAALRGIPMEETVLVAGTIGVSRIVVQAAPTPAERRVRVKAPWQESGAGAHGIPTTAIKAYQQAARAVAGTCTIPWTLLAGIGRVETDHGRYGGSQLGTDGISRPLIRGLPLNGVGPVMAIRDSDRGQLDGDRVWDRAVGPMQFIPTTWASWASDGDGDGVTDPDDLDDAALAAARYLCRWSSNLVDVANQRGAVRTYNNDGYYVDLVTAYEVGFRTGVFSLPEPPPSADELAEERERKAERRERRRERREARREEQREERRQQRAEERAAKQAEKESRDEAEQPGPTPAPTSPPPTTQTPKPAPRPTPKPTPKPTPSPSAPPSSPAPQEPDAPLDELTSTS